MINPNEVSSLFKDCLFRKNEIDTKGQPIIEPIVVEGIANKFGFHPTRIDKNKVKIIDWLGQFPDEFYANGGGGWTFLNFCQLKDGTLWTGMHSVMEQLMCLGIAIGKVKYMAPRDMWNAMPGGMPYISINLEG